MLEYTHKEGQELLEKNIRSANENLQQLEKQLEFLREQITTTEVTMARVYNFDVMRRKAEKMAKEGSD